MVSKNKKSKLKSVPRKTHYSSSEYAVESVGRSIKVAESADDHHPHPFHAQRDIQLTHNWESLPVSEYGAHAPKKELFRNFRKAMEKIA
ncbi:hypothetical protein GF415_04025 [Candidatus Micrarchaeota archaeon]|nr:hypothetical protein [Candidatus Micrarchaeota archaeon]